MSEELEYLLSEIKDGSQDYIGTNGCKYQDLLREELDLLVNEIERLNKERSKTYENGLNYFLELQKKKDEIERLNNIINELEEYMIGKDIYKILLYKLRDLKDSDKE